MSDRIKETAHETPNTDVKTAMAEVIATQWAEQRAANSKKHNRTAVDSKEEPPIVRLANTILQSAIRDGASHIHMEPERDYTLVRFRIDGVLHEAMQMPNYVKRPLIERYKTLADLNVREDSIAQQGCIATRYIGNAYNLIASFLPALHGEKMVVKIADARQPRLALEQLGFAPEMQARIEASLANRRGMLVIAGATGSGKTTTQYALLDKLNRLGLTVIAIEDVYDYELACVTQIKLNKKDDYTADVAVDSLAILDTDVVALGGCLSKEALNTVLQMASGDQFVVHTMSSHSPAGVLSRLADIGVDPSLTAQGVHSILVQRLARRICHNCKEYYEIEVSNLRRFGYKVTDPDEMVQLARGTGCEVCRNTGYKGRIGLFELLTMSDELAGMVSRGAKRANLLEAAKANGMMELREDGLIKILQGVTTPEEALRVIPAM